MAKSTTTAYLLLIFLGAFGAHRFYLGNIGHGVWFIAAWLMWVAAFVISLGDSAAMSGSMLVGLLFVITYFVDIFSLHKDVRAVNQKLSTVD